MNFEKKIVVVLFLFLQTLGFSQIEVRTYPFALDKVTTLRYSIDYFAKSAIQKTGAHLFWDLRNNESPLYEEIIIKKKSKIDHFRQPVYEASTLKNSFFFSKKGRNFDEVGFRLNTRLNSYTILYDKPLYFSTKNLKYGATFSNNSSFSIQLLREDLPLDLISKLPEKVKAIKLVGKIIRKYHCDAAGRFGLRGEKISVLRLKVDEHIELKLYDISSGNEIPFIDSGILQKIYSKVGRNKYYLFFSNSYKYYFAKVSYNKETDNYVIKYQTDQIDNDEYEINTTKKTFLIYPNPTYNVAKMLISNFGKGDYKLELYNIIGKKIWEHELFLTKSNLLRFDFSFLRKGTYIIALKDKYGKLITTRKLVIISI